MPFAHIISMFQPVQQKTITLQVPLYRSTVSYQGNTAELQAYSSHLQLLIQPKKALHLRNSYFTTFSFQGESLVFKQQLSGQGSRLDCPRENHLQCTKTLRMFFSRRNIKLDYKYEGSLGKGGFSVVSKYCRKDGERFAVKEIKLTRASKKELQMIEHQLRVLRLLNHPNIVKFYESFIDDGTVKLVFEYLDCPLSRYVNAKGHMSRKEIKTMAVDLLRGVQYLHSKRVVHRDLKFDNVMVRERKDFGLSLWLDEEKTVAVKCGTAGYIAPELFSDDKAAISAKVDVFGMGCMLYNLCLGFNPFHSAKNEDLIKLNQQCRIKFGAAEKQGLSPTTLDLLVSMLHKEPEERISVQELRRHPYFSPEQQEPTKKPTEPKAGGGMTRCHSLVKSRERPRLKQLSRERRGLGGRLSSSFKSLIKRVMLN